MGEGDWVCLKEKNLRTFLGLLYSLETSWIVVADSLGESTVRASDLLKCLQFVLLRQEEPEEFVSCHLENLKFRMTTKEEEKKSKVERHAVQVGKVLFELDAEAEKLEIFKRSA